MTDNQLLAYGRQELDRQMATNTVCDLCSRSAVQAGYSRWSCCDACGHPICDHCAVEVGEGHFCPNCPHQLPF